jgi:hypothetical protein
MSYYSTGLNTNRKVKLKRMHDGSYEFERYKITRERGLAFQTMGYGIRYKTVWVVRNKFTGFEEFRAFTLREVRNYLKQRMV